MGLCPLGRPRTGLPGYRHHGEFRPLCGRFQRDISVNPGCFRGSRAAARSQPGPDLAGPETDSRRLGAAQRRRKPRMGRGGPQVRVQLCRRPLSLQPRVWVRSGRRGGGPRSRKRLDQRASAAKLNSGGAWAQCADPRRPGRRQPHDGHPHTCTGHRHRVHRVCRSDGLLPTRFFPGPGD